MDVFKESGMPCRAIWKKCSGAWHNYHNHVIR